MADTPLTTTEPEPKESRPQEDKRPAKRSSKSDKAKSTSVTKDDEILNCLKTIQEAQKKSDNKVDKLVSRISDIETYMQSFDYNDVEVDADAFCHDDDDDDKLSEGEIDPHSGPSTSKRPPDSDGSNRFSCLSKRFKTVEVFGPKIDDTLAQNVTDLFRKGMNEEQFDSLIKDENSPRPENCEGLQTVRMNRIIWDIMSSTARTVDSKMQKTETAIVKASVLLTNNLNKLADLEKLLNNNGMNVTPIVEGLNDSIALLGHANYLSCMVRKDLLKPELKREFSHLCNHSIPYTNWLFGDDVSKTVKEIEESSRMGHKVHHGSYSSYPKRGVMRGRFRGGFRPRPYSTTSTSTTSRGRGYYPDQAKNQMRRGGMKPSRN